MKVLFSLSFDENDDIDTLKGRSIKNSKSLLVCFTITALVAAFDSKAFMNTKLLKSYLAGGNEIINFCRQTNGNVAVRYFTQHMAYVFISCTSGFSYLC